MKFRVFALLLALGFTLGAGAQDFPKFGDELYQPQYGQSGKDVIWIPTPDALVTRSVSRQISRCSFLRFWVLVRALITRRRGMSAQRQRNHRCFFASLRSLAAVIGVVLDASGWRLMPSSSQRWKSFTSMSN